MNNLTHKGLISSKFSKLLLKWHETRNKRQMPWKEEKDPYKIWLSEIILQQTRVEQGMEYYNSFIQNFPTISHLALAEEKKVFKLWEGLGYYSRCRNLIATAKYIHQELQGIFPGTYEEILNLKGIGPYTASAIASFAFNLPFAVVDGNVFRILARVFGITDAIDSTTGRKKFTQLATQLLDKERPGKYNQAIMDFGATVCKPAAPLCFDCIFKKYCIAYTENKIETLPVKEKKIKQRNRFFFFFLVKHQNKIAIRERTEKDIWRHLHEFPVVELAEITATEQAISTAKAWGWVAEGAILKTDDTTYRQKLTHQSIHARVVLVYADQKPAALKTYDWVAVKDLKNYSFPKIINDFLSGRNYAGHNNADYPDKTGPKH
ncbi:MAG: A/G-specific adenine glycosylase [Niabella sp.]